MADDFSTGVELEIEVSDKSLRDAKSRIEREIGDLSVDVNATLSGGGNQPRDPRSGQFMAIEGVEQRVVTSNTHLEDILNVLLNMDEKIGQGGGGGTNIIGTGAGAAAGTALGGLTAAGLSIFGGQEALARGAGGQTGQRVAGERRSIQGLEGLENFLDSPGEAMATGFKQTLDPTGIGETMASEVVTGITSSTSLDEKLMVGLDANIETITGFSWPSLPEAPSWMQTLDNILGGGGASGMQRNASIGTGTQLRGGFARTDPRVGGEGGGPQIDIDLGGITVDVTTSIENAVDDAVSDVEDTVDREVARLERRVSDALGGFF